MKRAIAGAIAGLLMAWAGSAVAQDIARNPPVLIKRNSGEDRKICFHKKQSILLFPFGCVTLQHNRSIYRNRENRFTSFRVKVYEPRLLAARDQDTAATIRLAFRAVAAAAQHGAYRV